MLTQEEMLEKFRPLLQRESIVFHKKKNVLARKAIAGEVIQTRTGDGLETTNAAEEGDFIVRNQTAAGEEYIVPGFKFSRRYEALDPVDADWREYRPTGIIRAIELNAERLAALGLSNEFQFIAPWGEPMSAKAGDFLGGPENLTEIYRLARKEFFETYEAETPSA